MRAPMGFARGRAGGQVSVNVLGGIVDAYDISEAALSHVPRFAAFD